MYGLKAWLIHGYTMVMDRMVDKARGTSIESRVLLCSLCNLMGAYVFSLLKNNMDGCVVAHMGGGFLEVGLYTASLRRGHGVLVVVDEDGRVARFSLSGLDGLRNVLRRRRIRRSAVDHALDVWCDTGIEGYGHRVVFLIDNYVVRGKLYRVFYTGIYYGSLGMPSVMLVYRDGKYYLVRGAERDEDMVGSAIGGVPPRVRVAMLFSYVAGLDQARLEHVPVDNHALLFAYLVEKLNI